MLGHDVEGVENRAAGSRTPSRSRRVVSAETHPNADRLRVCVVDTGKAQVQVVCGAPNAHTGMKGVFAPAGTVIPRTGALLKETVIRGVASRGMLCSAYELGLGDDHEGIIELPQDAPVGAPYAELRRARRHRARHQGDAEPRRLPRRARHRPRSRRRRARAAEAARHDPGSGRFRSPIGIQIEDRTACPLFLGRHIRGVSNGPSPALAAATGSRRSGCGRSRRWSTSPIS